MATQMRSAAATPKTNEMLSTASDAATPKDSIIIDDPTFEEQTDAEKNLLRKIDMRLLPTIWLVYLLSYMVSRSLCHGVLLNREAEHVRRTDPTLEMLE